MRVLVVYCHPVDTSFCAALYRRVLDGLAAGGHEIRSLDLYAEGFQPVLTRQEWLDYLDPARNTANVTHHIEHVLWAEGLVFVYPTWWYGLPAMLKGWLDRVWVPHATFSLPEGNRPGRGTLSLVRRIVGITTYGAPWWWIKVVGDPGRRTLLRGVRALCARWCRTDWLVLYRLDASTPERRAALLRRVGRVMARF
ncbi:MAG: NAD(P)H-dependent oxidoreductase [Candidatus Rokuibacteriota bacterium]